MPISENSEFNVRFNMVLTPSDRGKLQALAADAELNESELIRQWLTEAYTARFGNKKPPEPVAKYNSREARTAKARTRKK